MPGVVRPGPASGWYWTVRADVLQHEALDGPVVEVQVRELAGAEVGVPADRLVAVDPPAAVGRGHGEAVVLGGDLDPAGLELLDRMVGAAVAERQLERVEPDGPAQQLVAQADADDRLSPDHARARSPRRSRAPRGRRAVGEEDQVRVAVEDLRGRGGARKQGDGRRAPGTGGDRELDAGVDRDDVRPSPAISTASSGVTVRARSAPSMRAPAAIALAGLGPRGRATKTPPRIAPWSRMWRTRARVSTPVIAGTPQSRSQSSQPPSARGGVLGVRASRMIAARAWIRSDSIAAPRRRSCRSSDR